MGVGCEATERVSIEVGLRGAAASAWRYWLGEMAPAPPRVRFHTVCLNYELPHWRLTLDVNRHIRWRAIIGGESENGPFNYITMLSEHSRPG